MNFNLSKLKYDFKEFIGIYENAFTPEECEDTIKLFENYHKAGYTYSECVTGIRKNDTAVDIFPLEFPLEPTKKFSSIELDWDPGFIKSFHKRFYDYIYPIYNIQYPILQTLQKHKSKYIKIQKT